MKFRSVLAVALVLAALPGCNRAEPAADDYPSNAQVDSGNVRFAQGDHTGALQYYQSAAAAEPTNAAAWFGMYMAGQALGDSAVSATAMNHVQTLVPDAAWAAHPHSAGAANAPRNPH
jgi:Flp pilus assembly protein TadD